MIKKDIKQIKDIKELQRLYIELNNDFEKQEKEMELLQNDLDNANSKLKDYLRRNIRAINLIENMLLRFDTFSALEVKTIKYILEGQGADDNENS